jgi:hypothetical protein
MVEKAFYEYEPAGESRQGWLLMAHYRSYKEFIYSSSYIYKYIINAGLLFI